MDNELDRHKSSDKIKWLLTLIAFILVGITLIGIICGWFYKKDEPATDTEQAAVVDGDGNAMDEGKIYQMPKTMAFTSTALTAASTNGVSVQIEAYVYPTTAANKAVDYSVKWGTAPSHGSESVSNYLTVTQASDGSTVATVTCKKAFGNDKIIITVTTRDGGYTATCTVSFVGTASGISITSSTAQLTTSTGRGQYFSLGINKSYAFNINLSNAFNSVGTSSLKVSVGGVGSLYFGTMCSDDNLVLSFKDVTKKNMSEIASWFITSATISGTTLTVKTGSQSILNYYSSYGTNEFYTVMYYYDHLVVEYDDYYDYKTDPSATYYNSNAKENMQLMPSCYFTLTVTDSVSGLSETVKLWLDGVTGVSLSNTLSF